MAPKVYTLDKSFQWPNKESFFYLMTEKGLMLCRNHQFYRSCVPAGNRGPSHLLECEPFVVPKFPRISVGSFERIVGFFKVIAQRHGTEVAATMCWDNHKRRAFFHIPEQKVNSVHVDYKPPIYGKGIVQFGDIHSHVFGRANPSGTDENDELHSPGIHIIVGELDRKMPDFRCTVVVDGQRFQSYVGDYLAGGYFREARTDWKIPEVWFERVEIQKDPKPQGRAVTVYGFHQQDDEEEVVNYYPGHLWENDDDMGGYL